MRQIRWLAAAECAGIAFISVATRWIVSIHSGLNLMDWGYLWYGAWRTRLGEIPLRDFQSYDPGRYYYLAAASSIFGDGVVGTRASLALAQWIAIALALLVLRRAGAHRSVICACALVLAWWMVPDYKLIDASFSLAAIWAGVNLAGSATTRAYFVAGAFVGFAAMFGRNHGVYAALAFGSMLVFLRFQENRDFSPERLGALAAGVVAGYSPIWIASLAVSGFYRALLESVRVNIASNTNIPLPIPWPWRAHYAGAPFRQASFDLCIGLCYLLAYAGVVAAILFLLRSKWAASERRRLLLASTFVSAFYLHHATVRAEAGHFAEATAPLVLLAFAAGLSSRARVWIPAALIGIAVAIFSIGRLHPVVQRALDGDWVPRAIDSDTIWIDRPNAQVLDAVVQFDQAHNPRGEPIFLAPNMPALYRILRRKSPTWEIYFVLPASRAANFASIRALEASGAREAILGDIPLDHKDFMRFRNTHPWLYQYIRMAYRELPEAAMPGSYRAYEKR